MSHQAISGVVSRNSTGQERVDWHIQGVEGKTKQNKTKTCQPRILYTEKLSFRCKEGIDLPREMKAKEVYHH